jgi:hypothetical protein
MDLVPENLNGAVVFNVLNSCGANRAACGNCADFAVAVHNWIMTTEVKYVLVDLQDEKEVCPAFLEEMLQLAKRLRYPFVFAGVMDKPKRILQSYDFLSRSPTYVTPEEAVVALEKAYPGITKGSVEGVDFGVPIASSRPPNALATEEVAADAEAAE